MPTFPIFAFISFVMLGLAHVDVGTWNLASCKMYVLELCTSERGVRLGGIDGVAHDQRLQLNINREIGMLHHLPPNLQSCGSRRGYFVCWNKPASLLEKVIWLLRASWKLTGQSIMAWVGGHVYEKSMRSIQFMGTDRSTWKTIKTFSSFSRRY